jgi:hypothetical protein
VEVTLSAVEMTGTIDEHQHLLLDGELPISGPARVRVLIVNPLDGELDEAGWLAAAAHNPTFPYLHDSEEDIYSLSDGKPFHHQD